MTSLMFIYVSDKKSQPQVLSAICSELMLFLNRHLIKKKLKNMRCNSCRIMSIQGIHNFWINFLVESYFYYIITSVEMLFDFCFGIYTVLPFRYHCCITLSYSLTLLGRVHKSLMGKL